MQVVKPLKRQHAPAYGEDGTPGEIAKSHECPEWKTDDERGQRREILAPVRPVPQRSARPTRSRLLPLSFRGGARIGRVRLSDNRVGGITRAAVERAVRSLDRRSIGLLRFLFQTSLGFLLELVEKAWRFCGWARCGYVCRSLGGLCKRGVESKPRFRLNRPGFVLPLKIPIFFFKFALSCRRRLDLSSSARKRCSMKIPR